MEVQIVVKHNTDMSAVQKEYPDMTQDLKSNEGDHYYAGISNEETTRDDNGKKIKWFTYDEAAECCGFVEGAIEDASTLIEGNGTWAQNNISRKDFSGLAISTKERQALKKTSLAYWRGYNKGKKQRGKATQPKQSKNQKH